MEMTSDIKEIEVINHLFRIYSMLCGRMRRWNVSGKKRENAVDLYDCVLENSTETSMHENQG